MVYVAKPGFNEIIHANISNSGLLTATKPEHVLGLTDPNIYFTKWSLVCLSFEAYKFSSTDSSC